MSPECVCKVSAQNTTQTIYNYHFENAHFEWKQKHADFHDMSPLKFGHVPPRLFRVGVWVKICRKIILESQEACSTHVSHILAKLPVLPEPKNEVLRGFLVKTVVLGEGGPVPALL